MSEKRKISVRKIIQTLVTIVLLGCCVLATLSASKIQDQKKINGVTIEVKNEERCKFVSKALVWKTLFENRHIQPEHIVTGKADLRNMEQILATNPWIEYAQVFIDNKKQLNIQVTQRVPQLRIFQRDGNSYYLDSSGHALPLSDNYTHYEVPFVEVPEMKNDSLEAVLKQQMITLSRHIKGSAFWQAQTSQVVVNGINDFDLVPVLGNHKIRLGSIEDLDEKLENLFAFYQDVLNKIGWDRYTLLDARFKNQVVASPSLPWKAPVDRALTNMNWVKTIVGNAPIEENIAALTMQAPQNTQDSIHNKTR